MNNQMCSNTNGPYFLQAITADQAPSAIVMNCGVYARSESWDALHHEFERLNALIPLAINQVGDQWNIVKYYGNFEPCPDLQQLIRDIEDKRINTIVVSSLDRLTRSVVDAFRLVTFFQTHGISLLLLNDPSPEITRVVSGDRSDLHQTIV